MLDDSVVVITGASQGIGYACAERFSREGAVVVLSDVKDDEGEQATQRLRDRGGNACYISCDVSAKVEVQALIDFTVKQFGRIDTVIANAGIVHVADILELDEEDFDRVISIDLKGVFLTGQIAAKSMIKQSPDENGSRGSIINKSSVNGVLAIPTIAPYAIAKDGVNQWTKCLAIRLAKEGIRVNGIGPGSINTEMFQEVNADLLRRREVLSRTLMGRPGEPDEIASVAVFLASANSSYITGQAIYPDGGRMGLNYVVPVDE